MNASTRSRRSDSAARPGAGKGLLGKSVRIVLHGYRTGERPPGEPVPAVPVLGRSNVGKSSLLNALLGVKVARVSQTPGRTQALFWYRVDDRFDIVDCPGYGYAKTSRESRTLFAGMIEGLLTGVTPEEPSAETPDGARRLPAPPSTGIRPTLVLLLVDGRLEPQDSDRSMALFLRETGVPALVAATKWDAVKPSQRVRRLRELTAAYAASDPRSLQPVSAETGENLHLLARRIAEALRSPAPDPSAKETRHAS